ncbi:hypothetical protein F443_15369 [Phytophthora nicotianae P1569]|uniref:Uncharacterized protein n=1 Tax=Phytophthora nicotianae P1569 TaxID=1317065 RepID=V9EIK0_PHYNI|nr:hypothetical protein F443_15369 [Phytophthora nicotianae P1569]
MEAVTHLIAIVALIEAQSENLVLSYMVVSRCLAQKKLKAFKFDAMVIEAPRAKDENEESHRRVVGTLDHVLDAESCGVHTTRPSHQVKRQEIAAVGNVPRKEEKAIYKMVKTPFDVIGARTESRRAEKQLLLRHNTDEIEKMKQYARRFKSGREVV